jgi:hypothetical protein
MRFVRNRSEELSGGMILWGSCVSGVVGLVCDLWGSCVSGFVGLMCEWCCGAHV